MIAIRHLIAKINSQILPIVILSLLAHSTLSGGRVVSSLFILHQGYSEMIAGLTYGLYGLMPVLLSLHMGKWIDQFGPRIIMRLSLLIIILGLLLPAMHLSISTVLFCAALSGLGFGGYILSAQTSVALMKIENESARTGMFAWLQIGTSISAVSGPILVGVIIDNHDFKVVYVCLVGIILCALLGTFYTNIPESHNQITKNENNSIIKEILRDRSLLKIYFLSMSAYFAWDCFSFMIPVFGVAKDFSATDIGLILSFFAAGTFIVRILIPFFSKKITELQVLCYSYAIAAVVFILFTIVDGVILSCVLSLIFGCLAGAWHPNIQQLILKKVGAERAGEASGLRLMTGNFSGMLGTTACGTFSALMGFLPVFISISAVMGISSWFARRN